MCLKLKLISYFSPLFSHLPNKQLAMTEEANNIYVIGYALHPKKVESYIKLALIDLAKQNNIDLIAIDFKKPLIDQGPFHCIIHKLYGKQWYIQLNEFKLKYPNSIIVDPAEAIELVRDRASMLNVVNRLHISPQNKFQIDVPNQLIVRDSEEITSESQLGMSFPVIAKPVSVDGSGTSHELCLVFSDEGLKNLKKTLKGEIVIQEFVKHCGVVFKVYVAGKQVKCVKRMSLPDSFEFDEEISETGLLSFSRISEKGAEETNCIEIEMPEIGLVEEVARRLREELGLRLFNFDMIKDCRDENDNRYLIIDINYFPGYAKLPGYERLITDFFLDTIKQS